MDTWIETKIYTINKDHENLGIDTDDDLSRVSFDLKSVIGYYETAHSKTGENGVVVELSSGCNYFLILSYDEFKKSMKKISIT